MVIDFVGTVDGEQFEGGDARGFLLELGSSRLVPGFEEQLDGASAGEERTVNVTFPEDYQAEHLAGKDAAFAVEVKEVKAKQLPELDDDLAVEAGGFDTLDELREDLRKRLGEAQEEAIDRDWREAAVDAAAADATVEIPHDLVHSKAHDMWHQTAHRLQHQGLDPQQYLQFVNKTEEELVTETEPDAERALRREAVLAAVIEAEGIEVDDDEMLDTLRQSAAAEPGGKEPSDKALRRSLEKARKRGQDEALREDIAMRKAVDVIVDAATPVAAPKEEADSEIWTPEEASRRRRRSGRRTADGVRRRHARRPRGHPELPDPRLRLDGGGPAGHRRQRRRDRRQRRDAGRRHVESDPADPAVRGPAGPGGGHLRRA